MAALSSATRRKLVVLLWVLALALYLASPLRSLLDRQALIAFLQPLGWWGPLVFVVLYAVSMVLGLPTVLFTVAAGALFGLLWGTIYAMAGATAGAMGGYGLSRYLLHSWAERRLGQHRALRHFRRGIAERGLWFVLLVRLVPVTPFNIENYLFGLTPLSWRPYLLGTVLGILPGTLIYVWLGLSGAQALEGGGVVSFLLALMVLMVLAVLSWRLRHRSPPVEP